MNYDVIIIGAGLGGLTAGAKLAKEKKRVLLIEQHTVVGGCASTIKKKDFKIDVGFHKIDGLDKDDLKTNIFKDLGVFKNIDFIKIPEFYRFLNQRVDIVIPYDYKKAISILTEKFPDEKKGIKKVFKVILKIRKETVGIPKKMWQLILIAPLLPFLYPNILFNMNKTIGDFLDSNIKNEDLKLTILATIKYYHDDPHTLSLLFFAIAHGSFFSSNAFYIKGGSQNLSNYLAQIIKDNGGNILLNHKAVKINTKNEVAVGVTYKNNKSNEVEMVYANNIIANVSVPITVSELLETKNMIKYKKMISELETACSIFSIYLGFTKKVKDLGNNNYSTFVFDENIWETSDVIKNHKSDDYDKRNFVFVDYSQIDSNLAPEGKSVGVINAIDYYDNWKDLNKIDYNKKKEDIAKIFIDRLNKIIPGIKDNIEYYNISTPMTIHRYTLNPGGSPYGFAQIPNQAGLNRVSQKSPIKNLYFASAWTMPGGGFTGAIISGYTSAKEILKKIKHKHQVSNISIVDEISTPQRLVKRNSA